MVNKNNKCINYKFFSQKTDIKHILERNNNSIIILVNAQFG